MKSASRSYVLDTVLEVGSYYLIKVKDSAFIPFHITYYQDLFRAEKLDVLQDDELRVMSIYGLVCASGSTDGSTDVSGFYRVQSGFHAQYDVSCMYRKDVNDRRYLSIEPVPLTDFPLYISMTYQSDLYKKVLQELHV